jgi:hypothetical protein
VKLSCEQTAGKFSEEQLEETGDSMEIPSLVDSEKIDISLCQDLSVRSSTQRHTTTRRRLTSVETVFQGLDNRRTAAQAEDTFLGRRSPLFQVADASEHNSRQTGYACHCV